MRIPEYIVRVRPRILTKDPRLRPQADAVLDPLSIGVRNDLYTFIKPLQFKHT